jgi:mannose-6-phosphate isomerase-like protein (cupin superfamily)
MRLTLVITLVGVTVAVSAQEPAAKTFASRADVAAMITKAKNDRKPDQANFIQPLLRESPYTANLEYRVQGINTNPLVHEQETEIVYVVEGGGTLTTGGKLRNEKQLNAKNRTGTSLEGGTSRHIEKGDFILVPENTPHAFTEVEGTLVIMSLHLPAGGATK